MNKKPLISIVTVCLNSSKTIRATIESVLHQTYDNYEYIIKDGGSTDSTLEICKEYEEAFGGKLRIISEKDTGIYNAMNQGISYCNGEIIALINSDDYYSEDTLASVAEIYENADSKLLVIIGDMERVSENGELIYRYRFTEEKVKKKQCFGHPSMFAAKAVYDKIGLYDESYKLAADGDWQYRAHEDEDVKFILCPKVFNHMREGGASDNPKYRWKWFHERVRMKKEHKRSSVPKIYWQEFKSVIRTDIKALVPKELTKKLYIRKHEKKMQPTESQYAISASKPDRKLRDLLVLFVLLDICFLPYIRPISAITSMLILIVWYAFKIRRIKRDREFVALLISGILVVVSLLACKLVYPDAVTYSWGSGGTLSAFSYSITYTAIFLYTYFYYFYFKTELENRETVLKWIDKLLVAILTVMLLFAVVYIISPGAFYNIRSFWTLSGREQNASVGTSTYYRYTGPFSDPNNAAAVCLAMGILIFENAKKLWVRYYALFASAVILFATMSVSAFLSFGIYLVVRFFIAIKNKKIKTPAILIGAAVAIVAIIVLYSSASEIEILQKAIDRLTNNGGSASKRIEIWTNLLKNKGVFSYLLFGTGNAIIVDGAVKLPHNGHLYLLYSYGGIAYAAFIYVFFRKHSHVKWEKYLYLIPLFVCFTMNVGLYDVRYTFLMAALVAYANAKHRTESVEIH